MVPTRRSRLLLGAAALTVAATMLPEAALARTGEKRAVPNYDGRGNADAHDISRAWWIPRVVLWPFRIIHEYVIRKPLGALVTTAERHHWVSELHSFFSFGPGERNVLVPTFLYDFGMKPSVGAYLLVKNVGIADNTIRVHAATWGPSWLSLRFEDKYRPHGGASAIALAARGVRRPDYLFLGLGPEVTSATRSRYGRQRLAADITLSRRLHEESSVALAAGYQHTSFRDGDCCADPSLDERIADGTLPMPMGYPDTYANLYERFELLFDPRDPRPAPGNGAYLHLFEQGSFDRAHDRKWIDYGGDVGAAVDLDGKQRVVTMRVGAECVDPVGSADDVVPFDQLATVGGDLMPGFLEGWMLGRSSAAAQLAYTWPVWMWLDGELTFAVGNAFDEHFSGLRPSNLRLSGSVGLLSNQLRDRGFEVIVGVGTEPLDDGVHVDSIRIGLRTRGGL